VSALNWLSIDFGEAVKLVGLIQGDILKDLIADESDLSIWSLDPMSSSPLLPLPAGLEIATIETMDDLLVVSVVSTKEKASCPLCFRLVLQL
jgi:hypothetical protein